MAAKKKSASSGANIDRRRVVAKRTNPDRPVGNFVTDDIWRATKEIKNPVERILATGIFGAAGILGDVTGVSAATNYLTKQTSGAKKPSPKKSSGGTKGKK